MKFRTEIEPRPARAPFDYSHRILALGSCFAAHIARRLARAKFRTLCNPTGILFNPLSIAATVERLAARTPIRRDELHYDGERWFHYGFHGDFSAPTADEALVGMQAALDAGAEALAAADRVILTFGTAWVFERAGRVVANCHRQPAAEFTRRRLSVEEIVGTFDTLMAGPLAGREVILTVSPVRHLGDTLEGNAASKATLRLAAELLAERHPKIDYFPAFEILTDDLRDYRFYADDLVHPAPQAIEYVWEKFRERCLTPEAQRLLPEAEAIVAAAAHRPRDPHSESHRAFCRRCLQRIEALPGIDFSEETAHFRRALETER